MFGIWFLELLYTFESGVCKLQVDLYLTAQIIKPTACYSIFRYKWSFFAIGGSSLKGLDVLVFCSIIEPFHISSRNHVPVAM